MKCELLISEELIEETENFFKSIGMPWIKSENLYSQQAVNIEFVHIPDILKIYSMEITPMICSISALGIGFYFCVGPRSVLAFDDGTTEGSVFCPMSNITFIDFSSNFRYKNFSSRPRDDS